MSKKEHIEFNRGEELSAIDAELEDAMERLDDRIGNIDSLLASFDPTKPPLQESDLSDAANEEADENPAAEQPQGDASSSDENAAEE